jgi:hypothetical protein
MIILFGVILLVFGIVLFIYTFPDAFFPQLIAKGREPGHVTINKQPAFFGIIKKIPTDKSPCPALAKYAGPHLLPIVGSPVSLGIGETHYKCGAGTYQPYNSPGDIKPFKAQNLVKDNWYEAKHKKLVYFSPCPNQELW